MTRRAALTCLAIILALSACSSGSGGAPVGTGGGISSSPSTASTASAASRASAAARVAAHRATWALPAPRSRAVVIASSGGLLVAGGLSSARVSTDTVWLIDAATGRTRSVGRLATAVHDATGFLLAGASYVVAGGASTTYDDVQRLRPGGTATIVAHLPQPRSDLVSTVAGGTGYVLGGYDGVRSLAAVLSTNDARRYSTVASLPVTVRYAAVAAVRGRLFVFGGEHNGVGTSAVQEIDPSSGTARVVAHLPAPLAHEAAFVSGDMVYLAGGRTSGQLQRTVWRWDPATRRAHRAGQLPYAVADAGSAVVGHVAYLVGGEAPDPVATVVAISLPG